MERQQRIAEIFTEAFEKDPSKQIDFLQNKCGGDPAMLAEIRELLGASGEAQANGFMAAPAVGLEAEHLVDDEIGKRTGQTLGHYKIINEIGMGGMGAIYLAARTDDFEKRVAVKIIKRGMDTDEILRRFRNERQILANLEHPNIAHLIDGGTTDDGLPFFVMEYVEGIRVNEYCQSKNLTETERLELFRKICAAVRFAHQNLVIHRDLKPSNILVNADGEPKLLDFGIAKLLNSTEANETQTNMRVLTPAYASPEQLRGEIVGTMSDVYSLGLILSEMLEVTIQKTNCSGQKDIDSKLLTPDSRLLSGDLQNIIAMSLRDDAARRYGSVEAFSEDIRRYIQGLPISARKDSVSYRASKFVKRNRIAVAVACLFVLSLIGGLATTLWQFRQAQSERARAERRFNDVRSLVNSLLSELNDEMGKVSGTTKVRQLLVQKTLEYLDNASREAGGDTSLERELATAYVKVGDIQGNSYQQNLGDTTAAMASYQKSLEIRERLVTENPKNAEIKLELAHTYEAVGDLTDDQGDLNATLADYQKAVNLVEEISAASPDDVKTKLYLAQLITAVGDVKDKEGSMSFKDLPGALEQQLKALEIRESLARVDPEGREINIYLNQSYQRMANLSRMKGDFSAEFEFLTKLQPIVEKMLGRDPENPNRKRDAAICYAKFAIYFMESGEFANANEYLQKSVASRETMANADKTDVRAQRDLAYGYSLKGNLSTEMGDAQGALRSYINHLKIYEDLAALDITNRERQQDLVDGLIVTGNALLKAGENSSAFVNFERARDISLGFPSDDLRTMVNMAGVYEGIGTVMIQNNDIKAAVENFEKSIALHELEVKSDPLNVIVLPSMAKIYSEQGDAYNRLALGEKGKETSAAAFKLSLFSYRKCLVIWADLENKNALRRIDKNKATETSDEVKKLEHF